MLIMTIDRFRRVLYQNLTNTLNVIQKNMFHIKNVKFFNFKIFIQLTIYHKQFFNKKKI